VGCISLGSTAPKCRAAGHFVGCGCSQGRQYSRATRQADVLLWAASGVQQYSFSTELNCCWQHVCVVLLVVLYCRDKEWCSNTDVVGSTRVQCSTLLQRGTGLTQQRYSPWTSIACCRAMDRCAMLQVMGVVWVRQQSDRQHSCAAGSATSVLYCMPQVQGADQWCSRVVYCVLHLEILAAVLGWEQYSSARSGVCTWFINSMTAEKRCVEALMQLLLPPRWVVPDVHSVHQNHDQSDASRTDELAIWWMVR
jgi:hypothetical protein